MSSAVHSISGANVYGQFDDTLADGLAIAKIFGLYLAQSGRDSGARKFGRGDSGTIPYRVRAYPLAGNG
jgi:hypothetical protein